MSSFDKIVGMFPNREIGERVAREILGEHTREMIEEASSFMGQKAMPGESAHAAHYVAGWYGALDFLKELE